MGSHNENLEEPQSEPIAAGLAPPPELETDSVPDSLVAEFSSLTTPYCWVVTEDAVAGYDGAEPSAVGKSGPDRAVAEDVTEALASGGSSGWSTGPAVNSRSGGCTTRPARTSSRRSTISAGRAWAR